MKSGKRKVTQSHQKPNVSLWATVSAAIGFVAYVDTNWFYQLLMEKQGSIETEHERDERMQYVRGALFTEDGKYAFDTAPFRETMSDEAQLEVFRARNKDRQSRFSKPDYWEDRYKNMATEEFDWFGTWNSGTVVRIKPEVKPFLPLQVTSILNMGCGNSRLGEELYNDGYTGIMNIDISQSVIDKMSRKFAANSALSFMKMDITNMTFADSSFDVIFDKGTLDALYTGVPEGVKVAVAHIFRMLKPGGVFVSMTFGSPLNRRDLNMTSGKVGEACGWKSFRTTVMHRDDQDYHLFLMTKPE